MKRRDFINHSLSGILMPSLLNGFSVKAFGNMNEEQIGEENILVIIQLNGGNDGLNTVIPIDKYSLYKNARSNIAIAENKLLKIPQTDKIGLHPAMKAGLYTLFQEGKANLIQSVGYPNPNFSHFRATDIWNSASDSNQYIYSGWVGRYLATQHPDFPTNYPNAQFPDPLAVQIGSAISTALQGPVYSMGMAITNPTSFYNLVLNKTESTPNTLAGKELKFLREVANQSNKYATSIKNAAGKAKNIVTYPNTNLAAQLKIVANLIGGGLKTKIYFVNLGGFDTHSNQTDGTDTSIGTHANLWQQISGAIKAFMDDLKALGVSKKVIGMTYSEFGRRIKSNASGGTDHGAAAPMFMFGEMVNPIVLGNSPDIPTAPQTGDNITMQYDFRSVYGTVLDQFLCMNLDLQANVLLKNSFQTLPLILPQACGKITANEPIDNQVLISNYPNPFTDFTILSFHSKGGHNMVQIFDNVGKLIDMPIEGFFNEGKTEVSLDTASWKSGIYYARFQNEERQQIRKMIKA
jgi:uncharacterized protein (DUF1501 family)